MMQFISLILSRVTAAREDERGATMVEYGLLVALIAVFLIVAITAMRDALATLFNTVAGAL
jgi:pilus assembly protein Flp/PilA